MSTELDIIENNIDRLMKDIVEIDMRIAKASGNVSVGFRAIKEMSQTLKANAAKAVHSPKVSNEARTMHDMVVSKGWSIKNTAKHFGCSVSTVRRNMDKVTENNCRLVMS